MEADLSTCRVLIKDFGGLTAGIKAAARAVAAQAGRPFRHLAIGQTLRRRAEKA